MIFIVFKLIVDKFQGWLGWGFDGVGCIDFDKVMIQPRPSHSMFFLSSQN